MEPLQVFRGNGEGGSVALRLFPTMLEYEHTNYFVVIPLDKIATLSYSKNANKVYGQVSIGDVNFHCDNKAEVYAAIRALLGARAG